VAEALLGAEAIVGQDEFASLNLLSHHTGIEIPAAIRELEQKPILHQTSTSREEMQATVCNMIFRDFP
jgi:hypothetical protein